jgi:hypothetical protein
LRVARRSFFFLVFLVHKHLLFLFLNIIKNIRLIDFSLHFSVETKFIIACECHLKNFYGVQLFILVIKVMDLN